MFKKFINKMKEGTEKMEKVITKTNNKVKKENKEMNIEMKNTKNVKKSKMYQEAEVMVFASNERNIKDVKEVKSGYECGMSFENYNDIQIGDFILCYEVEEVAATL